jgi:WD40 repeat protein
VESSKELRQFELPSGQRIHYPLDPQHLAFSPDGRMALAVFYDFTQLWEVASGTALHTIPGGTHGSESYARPVFSPDSRWLAVGEYRGQVRLLDVATWKERRTLNGHTGPITGLAFTPDGRNLISASADTTMLVWDLGDLRANP